MAKNKRFYWLKLKDDFFKEKEIKKLRRLENSGDYIVIYLKLMLLSINNEGRLLFTGIEENMFEQLSIEIDESEELIKETIDYCIKNRLLEIDGDEYFLTKLPDLIGSEGESTKRMREKREREKRERELIETSHCDGYVQVSDVSVTTVLTPVTNCDVEKENREQIIDLNKDLEKRLKEKKEEYKKYNKTKTEDLKPISESISQSIPLLPPDNNNSFSLSAEEIQYFIDCWSNLNVSDPIRKLNEKQTEKLIDNLKRYGEGQEPLETINCLIDSITDSNYLMGETEPKFELLINWVLKPENWKKVIDGEYQNWDNPEI